MKGRPVTTTLTPRHEHHLPCGLKAVTDDRHNAIHCARCGRIQEPVQIVRFHVNDDGYRRGPAEVVA